MFESIVLRQAQDDGFLFTARGERLGKPALNNVEPLRPSVSNYRSFWRISEV